MPSSNLPPAQIFAPQGRDAKIAQGLLAEAGIASTICPDFVCFQNAIGDDASFAVVAEEALRVADLSPLASRLHAQASWSDFPFIVLTQRGGGVERNPAAARLSEVLSNVTFLERPFHPTTFVSVARTLLKSRQRQFEARSRLEELYESEQRLRTALLAGRLGSWELDLTTFALTASATCKALFGRGADEPFSYEDAAASTHPDDRARVENAVRTSIETGADYAIEYRTVWPDGTVRWAEIHARLVQSGGDRRLVGVSADITERKTAESNLRLLNETLEERVTQRTEELEHAHEAMLAHIAQREHAEEQLRQAQKMETIGQLTGGVAHDFNNLLMAILGNLDLLRRHVSGNPKATRLLEGALQGAERGAVLTQRLLAFARKQDLQVEPISLAELVGSMAELLERSVGTQIELRFDLSPDAPPALADANQIELTLLNLVVNARDAMPGGGVLSISVDQADVRPGTDLRAGPYVRLSVTDTGDGMDADTLSKATEPFFTTKGLGRGTGLGLSMIHGLAVQLNGALILASEPGRGTVAELWLPATSARKQPEAAKKVAPAQTEVTTPMRILIVDDDPLVAMGTADMLEDLGHEVISAHSGAHALDIFQNGATVDLLITDFSMPNMTGVQLAKAIRELRPELPILLATGYAELPSSAELELPRISKPYVQAHLADALAKVMQREHTVT